MAEKRKTNQESVLLHQLGSSSRKIVNNHHLENLSEFVLHDLCSEQGFGIQKGAYLVHNPDFECVKGIAGYHQPESYDSASWDNQKAFTSHMKQAEFNKKVRSYNQMNLKNPSLSDTNIDQLVDYLQISDPAYHVWDSKHNNKGIFIFESFDDQSAMKDHLLNFLHMLSFCPVF